MFLNCGVGEVLRVCWTARRSNQSILRKSVLNIHWKDWFWSWNSNTLAPDVKNWFTGKDPDGGKDWRQEEKGTTEDEMVRWHHQLYGYEFEQAPGVGDGQEAWHAVVQGVAKSWTWLTDWTELNWTELIVASCYFVGFCHTMKWINYMYTYIPSLLDTHRSYSTLLGHHRSPS